MKTAASFELIKAISIINCKVLCGKTHRNKVFDVRKKGSRINCLITINRLQLLRGQMGFQIYFFEGVVKPSILLRANKTHK